MPRFRFHDAPLNMDHPHRPSCAVGVMVRSLAAENTADKLRAMNRRNAEFWKLKEKP